MNPTVVSALWITLIGMGLVFIALLLLWGLMALIVSATAKQAAAEVAAFGEEVSPSGEAPAGASPDEIPAGQAVAAVDSHAEKAAAAAVAVAWALQNQAQARPSAPQADEPFSAWQSVLRANRLTQKSRMYTRKERGNGK